MRPLVSLGLRDTRHDQGRSGAPGRLFLLGAMGLDDKLQRQTLGPITEMISIIIIRPRAPCSERHPFKPVDNQAGAQRRRHDLAEGVSFTDPVDGVRG